MKSGTHTKEDPCLDYDACMKLKKMGFDLYTRASYIGKEFVDWMGWRNSWKMNDPQHMFPEESRNSLPMISAPSILMAAKWFNDQFISLGMVNDIIIWGTFEQMEKQILETIGKCDRLVLCTENLNIVKTTEL